MILLSLDLSLNCSGYAIFDTSKRKQKDKLMHYGHIPNRHLNSRMTGNKLLHLEMFLMMLKFAFLPNVIAKEELSGKGKMDTAQLAKTHGICEKVFIGYEMHDINNMKFKKEFVGKGNASKDEVAEAVLKHLPDLHFKTDDESDAIGLGILHLQRIGEWK
jgi:Holliday junction resolvasome RuvABC endonuclease subunit